MDELLILQELGLTESEAKIYQALLETGSSLVGPIIKKTGLHRATTYQILQRLKEKGMVSSIIKGKKQYFEAADPERLMDVLKEKQEKLQVIVPQLKKKLEQNKEQQEVTVYSGTKGIRNVMDKILESLNPSGEYYDYGASGLFRTIMGSYWDIWQKKKKEYKIRSYVIFNEEIKKTNQKLLEDYIGKAKFHPKEYSSITDMIVYNDTVILFIWTAKPPIAVIIKNKDNAESYKNQFRFLWKKAKK